MTNSYLLEVIKALTPEEREEIASLLHGPQFTRGGYGEEMRRLYELILGAAPDFSEDLLNKHSLYLQIFSEKNMVQGKLEKLMVELNKLIRTHILTKRYHAENNETQQHIDWAKWLRERGMSERSRQILSKLETKIQKETPESLEMYREVFLISEERHLWESTHNQFKGDLGISNLLYNLELYYRNYHTELINRYLLQQKGPQLQALTVTNMPPEFWQTKSVLLRISTGVNQIMSKDLPSVEEFQDLMQLLQFNEAAISFQTLSHFYSYLRNTCTLLINGGNLEFIPILHEIHKDNLERNFLFINGELSPNIYINLVQIATRAKEWEWAKNFTESYQKQIVGGDGGQFFYRLNMAQCYFAEGRLNEALAQIPNVPSSSHYHLIAKLLELKIYYELDSELLSYKIDAFRKFIERTASKTIASNQKTLVLNFVHFLHQLSLSPKKDKERSARLVARINSKELVAERAWLLEKARGLG